MPMKCMYRRYENLIKKVINAEWSKVFTYVNVLFFSEMSM